MEGIAETWRTQRSHFEPFWLSESLRPQSPHPVAMRFVRLHGNARHYWNGRVLNANDWLGKKFNNLRPFDVANQWAGSFGGPIKKSTQFFSSIQIQYSARRYRLGLQSRNSTGSAPEKSFASFLRALPQVDLLLCSF